LIEEAEERARGAEEEVRRRVAGVEEESRHRTQEIEDSFETHKAELHASLERLEAFEADIKRRLTSFLEQQLKALESLNDDRSSPPAMAEAVGGAPQPVPEDTEVVVPDVVEEANVEPVAEAGDEIELVTESPSVFDSLPQGTQSQEVEADPALDDFRPFDDEEAALRGRRRRGFFRRRVDDWA
jgi:hypothetical protein